MSEKETIEKMEKKINAMCTESLAPDIFEKWLEVKRWLEKTRKALKPKTE